MVPDIQTLYITGLFETMCFQGVDEINYWYMKNDYLYHCDQTSQRIHKTPLNQDINVYGWEPIYVYMNRNQYMYE